MAEPSSYLTAEAKARLNIDRMLEASGWVVQDLKAMNLYAGNGVAVREFTLASGHGRTDYLLFVNQQAIGSVEAKPEGASLAGVEWQSLKYSDGVPSGLKTPVKPLPFLYESTGVETFFTNGLEPVPRSRQVFSFHRPETMQQWLREFADPEMIATLRTRLLELPKLTMAGLWPAQYKAIAALEASLQLNKPRALIQMATGSGKTFTAANAAYRLIKHAKAERVLFLVDRANLGRQTLKEFQQFTTPDDGRKFSELYNVQLLSSNKIDPAARVVITTVQRLYSILKGEEELAPELDEASGAELEPPGPVEVVYNAGVPIEMFDVVIVDECHRSIYGLWRQVIEYFDAFLIGLTATPAKQTFGFFKQNLVFEYNHEQAVADRVNVDFDVYRIRTEITEKGSKIDAGLVTKFRDRDTRKVRLEQLDDELAYDAKSLDRDVVAEDQIRTVVQTFRDKLFTDIFPGRTEVPKTLVFAKDDSHADDIVRILREEFNKGNDFAVKITYRTTGKKPEELLQEFRNSYMPRIAVTVDMIATGTDVKPLECVFFMRMVKSRNFFEQMKGRGVRVINPTDLQQVTPDATSKTHFVIVDAVGATETELSDTQPLDKKKTVGLDKLLQLVAQGHRDPDLVSSIAGRLARLDLQITKGDRDELAAAANGVDLTQIVGMLVDAVDIDKAYDNATQAAGGVEPTAEQITAAREELIEAAVKPLASNPGLRTKLVDVRRSYEQVYDETSKDKLVSAGFSVDAKERAKATATSFREFIENHHDEITALEILYSRPYGQRLTHSAIKELAKAIERPPYNWTPEKLWEAYETLDQSRVKGSGRRVFTDLVSLVRFALEQENELVPFQETVAQRFAGWVSAQEQQGRTFTAEQMVWLERIRDHVAGSLTISADDFEYTPFSEHGGLGRAYDVFGDEINSLLEELTAVLAA